MRTTSAIWDELHASDGGILETKAVINGAEYTDISAPIINRAAMQDAMTVGNVISASCVFTIRTTDAIPKAAKVEILSRYTDGETSSEWLPMGTFYISKRKRDPINGMISLECYDGLLQANSVMIDTVPWTDENGEIITDENDNPIMFTAFYPRQMKDLVHDIAFAIGATLDPRTVIREGEEYTVTEKQASSTVRNVLSVIAAANAGNWIVTPDNKLRLLPVVSADGADSALADVVEVETVIGDLQIGDEQTVSGVQYTYGDSPIPVLIGDGSGYIMNVALPYAQARALYDTVVGMTYRPYVMANCRYNPAAEIGDFVRYSDNVASVLYQETATYGVVMGSSIQAPDFTDVLDEYPYPYVGASQSALNQAKEYTVEKVENAVQAIDESLTQQDIFDRLTGGGEEQGVILYNGKIYINASYLQAGTVSANLLMAAIMTIGGQNNGNGSIRILDGDGNEIGRWDKNGININVGSINGGSINGASLTLGGRDNASGTLTVKDAYNRTVGEWSNDGILLNKGTIAGPSVTLGGVGNGDGVMRVMDAFGNIVCTFDNEGLGVNSGTINITKGDLPLSSTITIGQSYSNPLYIHQNSGYNHSIDVSIVDASFIIESIFDDKTSTAKFSADGIRMTYDDAGLANPSIKLENTARNGHVMITSLGLSVTKSPSVLGNIYYDSGTNKCNFYVSGTKSRVVSIDQYSNRLLYCYETPSPMFGDVGEGMIGEDGRCYIWLDPVFAQTITTTQYQVFLQRYGGGDCWVSERKGNYFVVEGTPGMAFGWEIKAKQKDYDQRRLDRNDEPFTVPTQTYGADAAKYINDLKKERIST